MNKNVFRNIYYQTVQDVEFDILRFLNSFLNLTNTYNYNDSIKIINIFFPNLKKYDLLKASVKFKKWCEKSQSVNFSTLAVLVLNDNILRFRKCQDKSFK